MGDTVRRTAGPWTPSVHALLNHLGPRLPATPAVLGFDQHGREILTFLPGRVLDTSTEMLSSGQIRSLVAWTRTFHSTAGCFDPGGPWRFDEVEKPTVIGHNDIAPYNVCFEGEELVGVFDWDLAGPTTPLLELAFIAWNCVPMWQEIGRELAAERLELIASTYGTYSALEILEVVPVRIQMMLQWIPKAAIAGDEGMVHLMTLGEPQRSRRSLDDLLSRLPAIAAQLTERSAH